MMRFALPKWKLDFWSVGEATPTDKEPGSPLYSSSEIALLKRQLPENSDLALDAARRRGAKIHPRVAALKRV
jgi:hypothetical protein